MFRAANHRSIARKPRLRQEWANPCLISATSDSFRFQGRVFGNFTNDSTPMAMV